MKGVPAPTAGERAPSKAIVGVEHRVLVGRETEIGALLTALDAAVAGRGSLLLVAGEPGIGKSRLADEFAAKGESVDARVLWGRCWEAGGAPAYWPWTQALRGLVEELDLETLKAMVGRGGADLAQLVPELRERLPDLPNPDPASPEVARFRLFDQLSGFLNRVSETQPVLMVLEDLHAADASSLLLLQFVAAQLSGHRMLVIGTYRDVELTRDDPLVTALPELGRANGTVRLSLSGLSQPDVARFIETITGQSPPEDLVAAIHGETAGNPLFVEELVRLLASEGRLLRPPSDGRWPIPDGVREVIGRRLDRLPEECRQLLTLACVVGRKFSAAALENITGRPTEDLLDLMRDAVAARLISAVTDEPGCLQFAHALVRDTLYEELSPADRVRLHRDVGLALEAMYAADPEPHVAELAHHFFEAAPVGGSTKAVDYAIAAGVRAIGLLAYEEAVRLFARAHRVVRASPNEHLRCQVLLRLGDAQGRAGATADSKETFLQAAEIATRLDQPELLAQAAIGYGGRFQFQRAGIDRHLVPLLKQALEALGEGDSVLRVRLMSRLAGALRDQPSIEARASLAREALEMARRIGDPDTLTYALIGWWGATLLGPDGPEQIDVVADELDRLADEAGDRELKTNATWVRFIVYMARGQMREARAQQELIARLADELGQPPQLWYSGLMATVLALQDGRFDTAERLIDETFDMGRHAMPWDAEFHRLVASFVLFRERGRLAELEGDLRHALATHPGYRSVRCMILTAEGSLGRLDEARALFDELAADDFAAFPKDNEWLFALTLLTEAAIALEDHDRAAVLYEQLAPYSGLVALAASEVSVGPVSRPLGSLAALLGRYEEATMHFVDAIDRAQHMEARPWRAHAQYEYATMLAADGPAADRKHAIELLTSALPVCEDLGMTVLGDRVRDLLTQLGVRPRRRPPAEGVSSGAPKVTVLTPREREVADLVAEGLSNRKIAERLYVSERTAETHVQNILVKLGFTSRAQIAAWSVRENLYVDGT
jgi:DNA-binding CsgD family transcriptional regulator/tetratricopeptide (TPR) repeat protein